MANMDALITIAEIRSRSIVLLFVESRSQVEYTRFKRNELHFFLISFEGIMRLGTTISSLLLISVFLITPTPVLARVVKITITARGPAHNGQTFGSVGAYETIKGIATGEIDPSDRRNALITDLGLAPKNAAGRVEYRANFTIVKPVDMTKTPGVLFYNVVNRGNHGGTEFNMGTDPGDGLLYRLGHVLLWSGWQGDIPLTNDGSDREGINVPVARNADGSSITGPVWDRFTGAKGNTQSLTTPAGRTPASLDTSKAKLISVKSETAAGIKSGVAAIAPSDWAFADCRTKPFPGTPDPTRICLKNGFDTDLLYEVTYTAKDPFVLGVGMAATRDVISFFRSSAKDDFGTVNPLAAAISHTICQGTSQSGRFEKEFLNLGFNEDENGQMVCDGMNTRIAGMMGGFNVRFAKPGDMAELYDPGADGPIWWGDYTDEVRGRPSWGILNRCTATKTCPKITETYGGVEIWYSRATIGITGNDIKKDLPLPDNVRRYYHPGTTHGGGRGGFQLGASSADPNVLAANPNSQRETDRALYVALVDWVVKGTLPPPSAYPNLKDGTLVADTSSALGWPNIPRAPKPDGVVNAIYDFDYGAGFHYNDDSGVISNVPPPIRRAIFPLVPKLDADGNELGGIPSLLHRVPLGTYTGWNPVPAGALKGHQRQLQGGYIPFARTKAERLASGDPRLSIEERYPNADAYYQEAQKQADLMVKRRYLLQEDATRLLAQIKSETAALFGK
jgi:hypothetical protein